MLGANDGILSTSSLVLGVAASGASRSAIVTAGVSGLVAGAGSMAAGEYVSVSSQRDTEEADLRLDHKEAAEHMMLVDLARNDVARVCEPGTRHVAQLMGLEIYARVMHLVSSVKGVLAKRAESQNRSLV